MVHVHYFGDRGRHSWVSANCMMQFTNLADFLKLAESLTAEIKKKDPKYAAAFIVKKPGAKSKWQNAVQEAEEAQPMTILERIAIFATKAKTPRSRNAKSLTVDEKNKNKRKLSTEQDEPDIKRAKQDNVMLIIVYIYYKFNLLLATYNIKLYLLQVHNEKSEVSKNSQIVNGKIDSKLNSDSLPSSPSSHKSFSESTNTKNNKNEKNEENMFELYYEDGKDSLEKDYPDMPKEDIKKYLRHSWNKLDSELQKKIGNNIKKERLHKSKENTMDEDEISIKNNTTVKENKKTKNKINREENSVLETKRSSRLYNLDEDEMSIENDTIVKENKKIKSKTDKEETSIPETKRSRLYNLFKGMKQEKVCQICEKTGKLTRCKGPCYSYFHLSCVKPGESSPEYSVDENTLDDRLLSDLNIIKRSINDENENNGNYKHKCVFMFIYYINKI